MSRPEKLIRPSLEEAVAALERDLPIPFMLAPMDWAPLLVEGSQHVKRAGAGNDDLAPLPTADQLPPSARRPGR